MDTILVEVHGGGRALVCLSRVLLLIEPAALSGVKTWTLVMEAQVQIPLSPSEGERVYKALAGQISPRPRLM